MMVDEPQAPQVVDQYGVVAFPTAVVIDAEGKVAALGVGGRSEAEMTSAALVQ